MGNKVNKSKRYEEQPSDTTTKQRALLCNELKTLRQEEERKRLRLIDDILILADKLDVQHCHIADTTLSVSGVIGAAFAITGFGLAFPSSGASLPLIIVGGVIGGGSGVGSISSQASRYFITKKAWKKVIKKVREYEKQREKVLTTIWNITKLSFTVGGATGSTVTVVRSSIKIADVASDVADLAQGGAAAGRVGTKTAAATKAAFSSMSTAGKVFHFIGFGASVIGLGVDLYTIVDRSKKIHKKQPSTAAEDMRRLAYRLKGPYKHWPSVSERRIIDREFRCRWATY